MANALMIQGTGSGVGKSLIVAGLCRIFCDMGIKVAPFKSQNMALNSFITAAGGEIGRAQALQAEAARIEATVDMNPVLLKATGDMGSQVIIHGKAHSHMKAREYYAFKKTAWKAVRTSFERLSGKYELILIEGAGSPAEINLTAVDIANMSVAKLANAPTLLVGDIEKGGVFASLYGTVKLLGRDGNHIKAFVINKFRGDPDILAPGLEMIKNKTGRPVIGVLPYIYDIGLPEEDGMALSKNSKFKIQTSNCGKIKIVIVRLQYISNFTDFDPFIHEPDIELIYSENPADIENADIVIIPGSKNTVKDLMLLKEKGLAESIKRAYSKGINIIGMCGGYQMLGRKIQDPHAIESRHKEIDGIGLLNIETFFENSKTTCRVEAELNAECGMRNAEWDCAEKLKGYEIHMGRSTGDMGLFRLQRNSNQSEIVMDGSKNENCWGTYLHGIFENDIFRRAIIAQARTKKGLAPFNTGIRYSEIKERAIDDFARMVKENLDMDFLKRLVGI